MPRPVCLSQLLFCLSQLLFLSQALLRLSLQPFDANPLRCADAGCPLAFARVPAIQTRRLGRAGHRSSLAILGGAAFWGSDLETAGAAFDAAISSGVNHLDIAPRYGHAQQVVGPFVPPVRDRLFVGCKTLRRDGAGMRQELEESLRLLGCDSFDLYQLHAVTSLEELDRSASAAQELVKIREEGVATYVGITGHDLTAPAAHLEALRRYDLDTVMFPVNPRLWADPDYRRAAELLLSYTKENDIGVMAIKSAAARPWGKGPRDSSTWYEPYTARTDLERNVGFTLSVPGVDAICTPGDLGLLPTVLDVVSRFEPMSAREMEELAGSRAHEDHIFPMPRG